MSTVVVFSPPKPVDTPKGPGRCFIWENPGMNEHNLWHCEIDATGEMWTFENPEIRGQKNVTFGIRTEAARSDLDAQWGRIG
jgi:hypothetical protein